MTNGFERCYEDAEPGWCSIHNSPWPETEPVCEELASQWRAANAAQN